MATIKISTPEYDLELENSELIPATQEQLEEIVAEALKGAKKRTSKEVMADIVPAVNKELDRLFAEAGAYVRALKPEKGEQGEPGKDGVVTGQHKLEIALSVESQLGPQLQEYADERIEAYSEEHTALHEALDVELEELERKIDSIEIPEPVEVTGDDIVEKLGALEGDNRLDAKAIKNLPEGKTIVQGGGSRGFDLNNGAGQYNPVRRLTLDGGTVTFDGTDATVTGLGKTDEEIEDIVANLVTAGDNITVTYDDNAGTLTIDADDQTAGLATVATTGSYNDLIDQPTIPAVDDTVYGASWNGNTDAPTKNAVYDKIETIGGGSPGGADTQIQFNDGGSFAGDSNFTWDSTNEILYLSGKSNFYDASDNVFLAGSGNLTSSGAIYNVGVGSNALSSVTTGDYNVAIGKDALSATTNGVWNIAIGGNAGKSYTQSRSVFLGLNAGINSTQGGSSVYIGYNSGGNANDVSDSVVIGDEAGRYPDTFRSFYLGSGSGRGQIGASNSQNVGIGYRSLYSVSNGIRNIAIGTSALSSLQAGDSNTYIGYIAGLSCGPNVENNTAIGSFAMRYVTGDNNTAIGDRAIYGDSGGATAQRNVGLGVESFYNIASGYDNVAVGFKAGDAITTGYDNILLGAYADTPSATDNGYFVVGSTSAPIVNMRIGEQSSGDPLLLGSADRIEALGYLTCNDSGATAQAGDIRYNTTTNKHEGYDGTSWNAMY